MLDALIEYPPGTSENENKRTIVAVVKNVAERLGNTPAVCRKHYIHPLVLESFMRQRLQILCGSLPSTRNSARAEYAMIARLRSAAQ